MATWPTTLPAPSMSGGYSITPTEQSIRTDMEVGNPRVRRRTAARVDTIDLSWTFSDEQLQTFREWFEDGTTGAAGGAAWFTINLATGTLGADAISARFRKAPTITLQPGFNWLVQAQVETRI